MQRTPDGGIRPSDQLLKLRLDSVRLKENKRPVKVGDVVLTRSFADNLLSINQFMTFAEGPQSL